MVQANSTEPAKEEMVHFFFPTNTCKFGRIDVPPSSTHTVVAIGHIEHYGQEKLVVKLDDGTIYQTGDYLEQQKEQLVDGCH